MGYVRHAGLLLAGIALGGTATFLAAHRGPRAFQAQAAARVPRGFLVAKSRQPGEVTVTLDLARNFGTNPGDPVRYYAGRAATAAVGSVAFSCPPVGAPGLGDVILVRLESPGGAGRDFVVREGAFGTLFEDRNLTLGYVPDPGEGAPPVSKAVSLGNPTPQRNNP